MMIGYPQVVRIIAKEYILVSVIDAALALRIRTPKSDPPVEAAGGGATQPAKANAIKSPATLNCF